MLKKKSIKEEVVEGVGAIWFSLALVSTIVLIVLNCTSIYQYVINKYQLSFITGLSSERLMVNYRSIISYLQSPSHGYLSLPDFEMSEAGMIHFAEVKNIFIALYMIVLLFLLAIGVLVVMRHQHRDKCILSICNKGANLIFIVFGLLILAISVNFSATFTLFHKLFFRNDYWIFDYRTDPVILALPEQLFMICSVIIISALFLICGYIKITHHRVKKIRRESKDVY